MLHHLNIHTPDIADGVHDDKESSASGLQTTADLRGCEGPSQRARHSSSIVDVVKDLLEQAQTGPDGTRCAESFAMLKQSLENQLTSKVSCGRVADGGRSNAGASFEDW